MGSNKKRKHNDKNRFKTEFSDKYRPSKLNEKGLDYLNKLLKEIQSSKLNFLILSANDRNSDLSVNEEIREVQNALLPLNVSEKIDLKLIPNTDIKSVTNILTEYQRNKKKINFLHYAGHSSGNFLMLDDEQAYSEGLAQLLKGINIIFLNGCNSEGHVHWLHEQGVEAVIATNAPINDSKALLFSKTFYEQLGAFRTIGEAFKFAVSVIITRYGGKGFERSQKGLKLKIKQYNTFIEWELDYLNDTILDWSINNPISSKK